MGCPIEMTPNDGWDPRVKVLQYSDLVTVFGIVTKRYLVLVDTLLNAPMAGEAIDLMSEDLKGRELLVINTHADWDHAWGNGCFAGDSAPHPAPILAHPLCRQRMESAEEWAVLAKKKIEEPDLYGSVRLVPPTITVNDGAEIHTGDLTLRIVATPGHRADHIAVFIPEIPALLAGDAAEYPLPFVDSDVTYTQMRSSLVRMKSLAARQVFYCHAVGRYDDSVINLNLAYFDEVESRIAEAAHQKPPLDTSLRDDELARRIGFTWDDACAQFHFATSQQEFYRGAHRTAVRAAVEARLRR